MRRISPDSRAQWAQAGDAGRWPAERARSRISEGAEIMRLIVFPVQHQDNLTYPWATVKSGLWAS